MRDSMNTEERAFRDQVFCAVLQGVLASSQEYKDILTNKVLNTAKEIISYAWVCADEALKQRGGEN